MTPERLQFSAAASLIALILLNLAWEWWLAPLRPGGSLLILKTVPLLLPLPGILRGRVATCQWTALLVLPYFAEGTVRAWSDPDPVSSLALAEAGLATLLFLSAIFYARAVRGQR